MKHIITVQHTQSVHHTNGMVGSWTDWDLTDLGKIQANNIGKKLNDELKNKEVIMYSSDLKRARQTADEIAKHLGVEPILRKELRERNLGKCCGKSVQWLRENVECPQKTVYDRPFSDAESRKDAWDRLSIWNAMYLGLTVESYYQIDIHGPAGGVSHMIVTDDGKYLIRHISDMSYING